MDFEGEYFVFDWSASYMDHNAFAIQQVRNGSLEEVFHPNDHNDVRVGPREDKLAVQFLKDRNISRVCTTEYDVEFPNQFFGAILWHREEITDSDSVPGQFSFYLFGSLNKSRIGELEAEGLEVIVVDPRPYISIDPKDVPDPLPEQLEFKF